MEFGEKYKTEYCNSVTGKKYTCTEIYRYTAWGEYHTNDFGQGLWKNERQLLGTCQFSVAGCKTEKTAKAKIRNYIKNGCKYV